MIDHAREWFYSIHSDDMMRKKLVMHKNRVFFFIYICCLTTVYTLIYYSILYIFYTSFYHTQYTIYITLCGCIQYDTVVLSKIGSYYVSPPSTTICVYGTTSD